MILSGSPCLCYGKKKANYLAEPHDTDNSPHFTILFREWVPHRAGMFCSVAETNMAYHMIGDLSRAEWSGSGVEKILYTYIRKWLLPEGPRTGPGPGGEHSREEG